MRKVKYNLYRNGIFFMTTASYEEATQWKGMRSGNTFKTVLETIKPQLSEKEKELRKKRQTQDEERRSYKRALKKTLEYLERERA